MIEILSDLDTSLFMAVNSLRCDMIDRFMMLLSDRFVWIPLYLMLLGAVIHRFGLRAGLLCALGVALAVTLADQTCATVIRPAVQRLRPSNLDNPLSAMVHIVDGYRGGPYGMPSCHAANTFAVATLLTLLFRLRRVAVPLFVWALVNCYSRMYLGVHYPGDLLCGAVVGVMSGFVAYGIVNAVGAYWHSLRLMPRREALSVSFRRPVPTVTLSVPLLIGYTGLLTVAALFVTSLV